MAEPSFRAAQGIYVGCGVDDVRVEKMRAKRSLVTRVNKPEARQ